MSTCFDYYKACVKAIHDGVLIEKTSAKDKEFHFQNWCEARLSEIGCHFEGAGRNVYPDFCLVEHTEGYEIKGLAYPGRDKNYDANSNVPTGFHNGREIFYVFGRYPKDTSEYEHGRIQKYPVIDLVICHGDFLNAQRDYEHKNKHVDGYGSYGDIMIRDRKMYVVPTPFALTEGTTGLTTLIVPDWIEAPDDFKCVGELVRVESDNLVSGYSFDLTTNTLSANHTPNPNARCIHLFKAYRLLDEADQPVEMADRLTELFDFEDEE